MYLYKVRYTVEYRKKGEIMISTYDDEIDTITQIMIDWFTNRIRQLDEFNQDQIYQSTLMIDEKTPLPCIGFYRNRIEPYKGNDKCVGKEKYSFDFAVCYFTNSTTPEYYNNVLYHFEEKVLIDIARLINNDNLPTHQDYEYMSEALSIDDITFKSSTITTILTNGTNYNWGNMVRMIYQVDFSIDVNKL